MIYSIHWLIKFPKVITLVALKNIMARTEMRCCSMCVRFIINTLWYKWSKNSVDNEDTLEDLIQDVKLKLK